VWWGLCGLWGCENSRTGYADLIDRSGYVDPVSKFRHWICRSDRSKQTPKTKFGSIYLMGQKNYLRQVPGAGDLFCSRSIDPRSEFRLRFVLSGMGQKNFLRQVPGAGDLFCSRSIDLIWFEKISSGRCPGLIRVCSMLSGASFANGVLDF